jgi:hypothetical protein
MPTGQRETGPASPKASPLVQIGDHLSKQYDVKG